MESSEKNINNREEVVEQESVEQAAVLQQCQEELGQWKDKFVQINADMANFKRRVEKDQVQWAHMAQVRILSKLLSIADNFERAMVEKPAVADERAQAWIAGMVMIQSDFAKVLSNFDVTEIPCDGAFDPELHEALMNVASDAHASGDIVAVLEKGYRMGDTILRPAKVTVAQ
jgi:molecular chaperone GrpE